MSRGLYHDGMDEIQKEQKLQRLQKSAQSKEENCSNGSFSIDEIEELFSSEGLDISNRYVRADNMPPKGFPTYIRNRNKHYDAKDYYYYQVGRLIEEFVGELGFCMTRVAWHFNQMHPHRHIWIHDEDIVRYALEEWSTNPELRRVSSRASLPKYDANLIVANAIAAANRRTVNATNDEDKSTDDNDDEDCDKKPAAKVAIDVDSDNDTSEPVLKKHRVALCVSSDDDCNDLDYTNDDWHNEEESFDDLDSFCSTSSEEDEDMDSEEYKLKDILERYLETLRLYYNPRQQASLITPSDMIKIDKRIGVGNEGMGDVLAIFDNHCGLMTTGAPSFDKEYPMPPLTKPPGEDSAGGGKDGDGVRIEKNTDDPDICDDGDDRPGHCYYYLDTFYLLPHIHDFVTALEGRISSPYELTPHAYALLSRAASAYLYKKLYIHHSCDKNDDGDGESSLGGVSAAGDDKQEAP